MKMFPILFNHKVRENIAELRDGYCVSMVISMPWPLMEAHEAQAQKNHSQSIARLAERGGLSLCEAVAVLEDREWRSMPLVESNARLKELFSQWQRAKTQ